MTKPLALHIHYFILVSSIVGFAYCISITWSLFSGAHSPTVQITKGVSNVLPYTLSGASTFMTKHVIATADITINALHINGRAFVSIPLSTNLPQPLPNASTPSTPIPNKFLERPAIIGLSIGIFTALLFSLTLGIWISRRRRSKLVSDTMDDIPRALGYRNELPGEDQRVEIDGRLKWSELEDKRCAHELCAEDTPIELPGAILGCVKVAMKNWEF